MTTNADGSLTQAYDVKEQHLFDENADTERPFCEADTSTEEWVSVGYCMEQRKNGIDVGTVCESCKAFSPPFALCLSRDLEAEGMLDEAREMSNSLSLTVEGPDG